MADIPLFPDESNMARFQDFVNIQKEISEHLLTQKHLYADIGRINRDVEDRLIKRRSRELDMLNQIQKHNIKYNELVAKRGTLSGQAAKDLENDIDATLQLIEYNRKLVDLSKLASSIEVEMAKKQYKEGNRWFKFASEEGKKMLGIDLKQFEAVKATGDKMLALGGVTEKMAYSVGAVIMMLTGAFNLFKKLDTAAWNFRKAMGMTRLESAVIRKDTQRIAIDNMAIGVTIESAYKSYQALGQIVGGVHNVSKSLAEDVSIMSAQLGISEEKSAQFLRNMAAVSKSTLESQTAMMYIAKDMSNAAGVQLDQVMGDIATKSSKTLTMMSRMPNVALRTAIELRRMGTDLDHAAGSSQHILDFTENVNEEMEASVLLGRSINLQRARELAYRRDLEGSTKEILRITKSVNFENLDVFQQEAFARATGRSVEELLKMLQTSKQLERVKRSGTPEQKAQLALYEKMRKENEAAARARAKDVSAELRRMGNQERLVQIQNKWNALLAKAQEFLLPVIDKLLGGALALMDWAPAIMAFTKGLGNAFLWVEKILTSGKLVLNISSFLSRTIAKIPFEPLFKVFQTLFKIGGKGMGIFAKTFGFLGKFIGVFAKVLGPIGWVIMAFQAISGFISGWNKTTGNWIQKLGGGLMGALRGVIPGFDYIVKAVKWVWNHMGDIVKFTFKWLSPIGLVVQAIKSIWPVIKDVFSKGYEWIIDKFSRIIKFFSRIFGGGVEKNATAAYIPAATITPTGTTVNPLKKEGAMPAKGVVVESEPMSEETGRRMVALLEKIASKDSSIHMDGQLLSTQLARQTEFRGGYGVNKVA